LFNLGYITVNTLHKGGGGGGGGGGDAVCAARETCNVTGNNETNGTPQRSRTLVNRLLRID
jgi:hypothetical protein